MALAVIAFTFVGLSYPHLPVAQFIIRTIGAMVFFSWIAYLGGIVGFHKGVDADRERQRADRREVVGVPCPTCAKMTVLGDLDPTQNWQEFLPPTTRCAKCHREIEVSPDNVEFIFLNVPR